MIVKLILAAALLSASAFAENARLPYRRLYEVEKAQTELNRTYTNLVVELTLQSVLPNVQTSDLSVYIDAKAGKIPIILGPSGDFTLPLQDDLLAENPWVNVNQPKGTMKLDWKTGVLLGRLNHAVHFRRLMEPIGESQQVQEKMLQLFPGSPRLVWAGLKFTFPSAQKKAVITIHAKDGDRKLEANETGEIFLPFDPDLMQEDPEVTLSDFPGIVEIVSHKSAE